MYLVQGLELNAVLTQFSKLPEKCVLPVSPVQAWEFNPARVFTLCNVVYAVVTLRVIWAEREGLPSYTH